MNKRNSRGALQDVYHITKHKSFNFKCEISMSYGFVQVMN